MIPVKKKILDQSQFQSQFQVRNHEVRIQVINLVQYQVQNKVLYSDECWRQIMSKMR